MILENEFIERAQAIKLAIFDVDGIFTNGKIYVDDNGKEIKAFHVLDGQGIKMLQQTQVQIAIISGRDAPGVAFRMQQLGIRHIYLGYTQKLPIYQELLEKFHLEPAQVAYMGDDLPDLPVLRRVGLPVSVPNAVSEIKQHVPYITQAKGGKGAVREFCEMLMRAQGHWDAIVQRYTTL